MTYAESDPEGQAWVAAFRERLRSSAGRRPNLRIATRWATPNVEAMQRFAKELVALQPDLIFSQSTPTTAALLQHTRTIPIIFANIADPSAAASSPAFRGRAATPPNVFFRADDGRQVAGAARGDSPRVNRVAFLFNPATATYFEYYTNPFKAAAASFGVEAMAAPVHDRSELGSAFAAQARSPMAASSCFRTPPPNAHSAEITSLAARYRLPAVYPYRLYMKVGGLLSYGNDVFDNYRRAAGYVDRISRARSRPTCGAGAEPVRASHQPQNRKGARARSAADAARPRRRGDRMKRREVILAVRRRGHPAAASAAGGARPAIRKDLPYRFSRRVCTRSIDSKLTACEQACAGSDTRRTRASSSTIDGAEGRDDRLDQIGSRAGEAKRRCARNS